MKVLSIVGPGRSGTTIVASILGEVPGIANGGELRWLWRRGLLEQRPCGCGRTPLECPVWSSVLARTLDPRHDLTDGIERAAVLEPILEAQRRVSARSNRLRVIRSSARGAPGPSLQVLRAVTARLCSSLADVTGAHLLVDTSKRAQDAAVLAGSEEIDHFVLQMVRDPRAVAYSWRRAKVRPTTAGYTTMATRSALSSATRWMENCLGAELLRRHVPPERWLFLRYEDFAAAPRDAIDRILSFVGERSPAPFLNEDTTVLNTNHTVAGNPNRFRTGAVRIVRDEEWRAGLERRGQLCVSAVSLPMLRRYGYPVRAAPS